MSDINKVVITHAKRTPIGKFMGVFSHTTAVELGTAVTKALLNESKLDINSIDQVIFGNARQAGNKPNPARQISHNTSIPHTSPSYTVNMACGSGLQSIILAYQAVAFGEAEIIIAGGIENMTRTPFLLDNFRFGYRLGHSKVLDGMYHDGLTCPLCNMTTGQIAENIATKYNISRKSQDEYALTSYTRCEQARKDNKFNNELVAVTAKDVRGKPTIINQDEIPRNQVTLESLTCLEPSFQTNGTIHPGNSCGIADGAAAVIVMSERKSKQLGLKPLAYIKNYAASGVEPEYMGMAPVPAIKKLTQQCDKKIDSFDLIEINEAFAAQMIAVDKELNLPMDRVNVNGGAIALGHPIGATGTRIIVTLLHEMNRRNSKTGLAALGMSGGMGLAVSFYTLEV
ncbi:MAG: acetyl-CoA C-acyltransferase [Candidatus Brocadiia bacterium]